MTHHVLQEGAHTMLALTAEALAPLGEARLGFEEGLERVRRAGKTGMQNEV